jgi:hypothetical protein
MRVGIELNGVLRDTISKITQVYEKHMVEEMADEIIKTYETTVDSEEYIEMTFAEVDFKYEIKSPVTSLNLMDHFSFKDKDELYNFMYEEFPMQIFGHAPSAEMTSFNDLNDLYVKLRDEHDLLIVSDEIGKSKPASLFFISKFGCLLEKIKFYSNQTINSMWNEVDVLLTANPDLLLNHPQNKIVVKYETKYNKHVSSPYTISSLKEFETMLENILKQYA